MRELQTSDLFAFVRLLNKAGVKEEIKTKVLGVDDLSQLNAESFGYDILFTLLEKASEPKIEKELYSFFADIFGMKEEEVKTMDAIEFLENVGKVASIERWKSFFSSAAKLTK